MPVPTKPQTTPTLHEPRITPTYSVVTTAEDSGPGSLRQAILDAPTDAVITFDPAVFPPDAPVRISVKDGLPQLTQGGLTIDASDAGVILDGSLLPTESWIPGLEIVSDGNTIQGMQVVNFTGVGIVIANSENNLIGGDREIGAGPIGQGNLCSNNDNGIALWNYAINNTVTGNLIGTDVSGTQANGNRYSGVLIMENGSDNHIGPDNIIAFNGGHGVEVQDTVSTNNTISKNLIHQNGMAGIMVVFDGAHRVIPPLVLDFDLSLGSLDGITCQDCQVEVFSLSDTGTIVYEGSAPADSGGAFTFSRNSAFTNPHITMTTTDPQGATSPFSELTTGAVRTLVMQTGNGLLKTAISTGIGGGTVNNFIGDTFPLDRHDAPCPSVTNDWSFTHLQVLGMGWARLSLDRMELNQARDLDDFSLFGINACQEEMVDLLVRNDIVIMNNLVYWDQNLHTDRYPNYTDPDEVQAYLDYVKMIVDHFKGRIQYYEILNEALVYVDVADYIEIIRLVVPIIRTVDPQAKIVVGGSSNLLYADCRNYLFEVLESDIMPLVDGIALHPMYGPSPQYSDVSAYYYEYPTMIQEIKDTARDHGFNGEVFAEEMAWRTPLNTSVDEHWNYTYTTSAKYYARGILINRGLGLWAGLGGESYDTVPAIVSVVSNLSKVMPGADPISLEVKIDSQASNIVSYAFMLENGDQLLALWTDGIAVDDDPGVIAKITVPGFSAQTVYSIDIVNSFQQELITTDEDGSLVIADLLIKDYPIILWLSNTASQ